MKNLLLFAFLFFVSYSSNGQSSEPEYLVEVEVKFQNGITAVFEEVTGLELTAPKTIEYRRGNNPRLQAHKVILDTAASSANVILRRGFVVANSSFEKWYNNYTSNTVKPENIIVRILDLDGKPRLGYELQMSLPLHITIPVTQEDQSHISVDELILQSNKIKIIN